MHMLAPCETRAPSPPGRCASLVRDLLLFVNSWFRHQGLTHQLLLASRIRPIRGLGRHRGVPPWNPLPAAAPTRDHQACRARLDRRRASRGEAARRLGGGALTCWGSGVTGGLLGVVMTPAEPVLNCSGTCTTLASPDTGTSTWSLRDMRAPGRDRRDRHLLCRLSRFRARRRGNVVICAKAGAGCPWCPASPVWRRGLPGRAGSGCGLDGSIRPDGRASSGIQLPSAQATGPRP